MSKETLPEKHVYYGPMMVGICSACGKSGYDRTQHFFNGSNQPCDNQDGPCACGAWHRAADFDLARNVAKGAGPQ